MSLARIGVSPWNKGLKGFGAGNNHAFKGDDATKWAGHKRAQKLLAYITHCSRCGKIKSNYQMVVHHKNGNQLDNRLYNLEKMCRKCHINHHRKELELGKLK